MQILRYEWKKLCRFRLLWILLLCLLGLNGYIQISAANERGFSGQDYRILIQQVNARTPEQADAFLEKQMEESFSGSLSYERYALVAEVQNALQQVRDYQNYLDGIDAQKEQQLGLSIWGGKDTFSYRNIEKTPEAYRALHGTELRLETSLGLEDALHHPVTDFLGVIMLFFLVTAVVLRDREQGMMPLLYSMPNGRVVLLRTKLLLIAGCTVGTVLLLFGENLIIGSAMYGLGDLSRPVQCILSLYTCNLPVSAGGYIVLFLALKSAAFLVFSMVFTAICTVSRSNMVVYGLSGVFCGISYLLYRMVPEMSAWSLLHYLSPIQILRVNDVIGTYRNMNVFGFPFSLKAAALIGIALFLLVSVCITFFFWLGRRALQYRHFTIPFLRKRHHRLHGQFYYVCYRSLILQKGIIPVLAVAFAAAFWSSCFVRTCSTHDLYYERFTTEQAGHVTDQTYQFIMQKQVDYAKIEKQIQVLQKAEKPNIFALSELYNQMNDRSAFEQFRARCNAIRVSDAEGELFYDSGYARLFGTDGNTDDLIMNLCILVFLCLLLLPYAAQDQKTGMVKILYASAAGKRGYWKHLLIYSAICGAAVCLAFQLPYIWHILSRYGTQGLSAPLQSMTEFSECRVIRSVRTEIMILLAVRTLSAAVAAMLLSLLSAFCRAPLTAYIAGFSLTVLPAALAVIGVPVMGYIGLNPFLSYNRLMQMICHIGDRFV